MSGAATGETTLRRHLVWLLVAAAYLCAFPYFPRLGNPNENVRLYATRALVVHGTFAIDEVIREWGEVQDRARAGGRRYSGKAPGTSLLGVPVYAAHRALARAFTGAEPGRAASVWALRVFTVSVPLCLFLLAFARGVERQTGAPAVRDLLLVGLGLGTLLYPYGLLFVGHAQSAACAFGSYLAFTEAPRRARPGLWRALAGLLAGLAVVFEYQALLVALALAVFAAVSERRQAWPFFAAALGPAALLGTLHTATFGAPWETPLAHPDDPIFAMYHGIGVLGFTYPRLDALGKSLFSLDYGLFVWSPLLAAGVVGAALALRGRERRDAALALAVTALMLLFLSGMSNWRAGWCAGGPRYVATVAPFLAWGVALAWPRIAARRAALAVVGGLTVAGVALCGIAGAHFPHYPLTFDDPVFDVSLPLLAEGRAPGGLGRLLGLPGALAFLPVALALAAAPAVALLRLPARAALGAGAIGLALLGVVAAANGRRTEDETRALEMIRALWSQRCPPQLRSHRGSV